MRHLKNTIWVFAALVFLAGCGSSKKSLQRGEYYSAAMEAIRQLRSSPNNKKQQDVLLQAYPLLKENSLRKISNAMEMNVPNKYGVAADEYLALNQVADAIYKCPKALQLIPQPEQYSRQLSDILPKAAEEAYNLGERQLSLNTIQSAREAFQHFTKTNEYVEGYRDVHSKIAIALDKATLKVIVQKPITTQRYQLSSDFFYNNLMAQMVRITGDNFVRFYSEEEARNEGLTQPDQYLVFDFEDFTVGIMRESKNTVEVTRDSVLVGTTTVNGREQNVYGKVKAELTTFRREVIAQGVLSAKIINAANDRIEQNRNFPGKFVWFNEWASYKGDDRALTDKQKKMTGTEPLMPPPQQDLFIEFTKPIFDQAVGFVRSYYKKP
jgi:tetratricopeptide (TPR) repeat protein